MGQVAVSSLVVNSTVASVSPWLQGATSSCSAAMGPRTSRPRTPPSSCRSASPRTDVIVEIIPYRATGSDGLVVGLYQDLVDGDHVVVLGERVDNRRGNVLGIEDTSATPGFLSRPQKPYSSML
jgi:hypothetical protein